MARVLRGAQHWALEQTIGSGSFAVVWKARNVASGQLAAVKEICTDKLNEKLKESLSSEIYVLERTRHKNIVGLLDLIKEESRIYLVLEFCGGGDLAHYLRRFGRVPESTAWYLLHQLADGLKMLRMNNLIHRDLKPQNLLLSDNSRQPVLKIADFGFARNLQPQGLAETLCGSPLYMAPEILQFTKYDAKADLWSVGTILFELLTGKPPFNGANHLQLLQNIERGEGGRLPESLAAQLSTPCKQLLHQLLRRNPVERIGFEEFFAHPFLAGPPPPPPTSSSTSPHTHASGNPSPKGSDTRSGPTSPGVHPASEPSPERGSGRPTTGPAGRRPHTPQPLQAMGPVMGVDQATGIVVRHVVHTRPASRSPPPTGHAAAAAAAAGGSVPLAGCACREEVGEAAHQASTSMSQQGGPSSLSGAHGGPRDSPTAPGPLGPFNASTVGHEATHMTYTEVDLGPSPAHTPHPGPGQPLEGRGQGGATAPAPLSRPQDASEHEDDYVVVASDGSRSASESGRPSFSSGAAATAATAARGSGGSAGGGSAGQGSASTAPSSSQAQSLMGQMSKGGGRAWGALGRLGPALLQPRLVAAATQQLRGVVSGMSLSQSTSSYVRPEVPSPSWQHTAAATAAAAAAASATQACPLLPRTGLRSAAGSAGSSGSAPPSGQAAPSTPTAAGSQGGSRSGVAPTHPGGSTQAGAVAPGLQISPQWILSLTQLPENVDAIDLLQRVLHILLDTGRARWEAALAAAEVAAETAAATAAATAATTAVPAAAAVAAAATQRSGASSHSSGGAPASAVGGPPSPARSSVQARPGAAAAPTSAAGAGGGGASAQTGAGGSAEAKDREKERDKSGAAVLAAASAAAARELEPAAAELLSLHLFCARLLDAALVGGAVHPANHPHAAAMLVAHARALLTAGGELVHAAVARLPAGRPLPRGPDTVYEMALRCCRAGAAEELMGQYHASVEQYAKAADLLLFLLSDVAAVGSVKPQLCASDTARVHKYYAAVKMRQRACMATLNAQLPAVAAPVLSC